MAKMNIYAVGGAGSNIAKNLIKYTGKQDHGFAELSAFFIDASRSNLTKEIPDDNIYLVDGLDGSGKRRDSNYESLAECSKEILHQFKPTDMNVVLHSASGGTGSVLGPIIVSELLDRKEPVIVLTVGNTSCRIETENTIKTLKSYEMMSKKKGIPVNLFYRENTEVYTRAMVDNEIQTAIVMLAAIFSGNNHELDSSDLKNFLNYTRVTSYSPKLSLLDFYNQEVVLGKGQSIVSLVTLVDSSTSSHIDIPVEYQAVGFIPETVKQSLTVGLPIHAAIIAGYFNGVVETLEKKLADVFDEARKVVVEKSIVKSDEEHTSEGLIL